MNPPDYFIDILEGIVKLNASSGVKYKELPLRWMLHNGYPVPPDMLDYAGMPSVTGDSAHGGNLAATGPDQSFAGDLWQDVKYNVGQKKHHLRLNFNKLQDLSNRKTPSVFQQYRYFVGRVGKQRLREARMQAVDYLILLLAGICLGTLAKVSDETFGSTGYLYTVIAVCGTQSAFCTRISWHQSDYIFIWDEDLGVEDFDFEEYIKLVKKHGLDISQPGLSPDSGMIWEMTRKRNDTEVHKGKTRLVQ
ncbi:ABC transporter G family member 28-like [Henckelia pumila]|uniref:ABC transporter G family member 28-like n=1 Tax=Henckelia pumila TaxID=405737 RepID=UPI003C6E5AC0